MDKVHSVLDHCKGLQAQEVKLHEPRLLNPLHVKLRRRHVRARILIQRHKRVQRTVANNNTRRMGRSIAQKPLNLLPVVKQARDNFFVLRLFAQARLVGQSLLDADRLHPFHRDHLAKPVDLPIRHLQHAANIAHSRL